MRTYDSDEKGKNDKQPEVVSVKVPKQNIGAEQEVVAMNSL
jgi:hypothetical protein